MKAYTVKCGGMYCGQSPRGRLELSVRPFRNMVSTDAVVARLRARSLEREFPGKKFEVVELA